MVIIEQDPVDNVKPILFNASLTELREFLPRSEIIVPIYEVRVLVGACGGLKPLDRLEAVV